MLSILGVVIIFITLICITYFWVIIEESESFFAKIGMMCLSIIILIIEMSISGYLIEKDNCNIVHYRYNYIDLDGNEGVAETCSYKFHEYHSGGQGTPVCEKEDGTVIMVKQYSQDVSYTPSYCEK